MLTNEKILCNCVGMINETKFFLNNLDETIHKNHSICDACNIIATAAKNHSTVVTTGMGKAGHVAQKTSSLLSSLGTPSFYIHPGESSHGDIGVIRPGDIMMVFSTSGKTREVIETIDITRKLDVGKIIAITSHPDSIIREKADVVVDMGEIKESGYLNIAPTTSIVIMMVIADIIATTVAEINNFTMADYYVRHHGGYLGEKSKREASNEKK